jgi:pimeloyl-ACP methyl ester carboxylesterase
MRRLRIADGVLAVADEGVGEPVVLVQTALTADELLPVAEVLRRRTGTRTVRYHRRGYGDSGPARSSASVQRDADDCQLLLDTLSIDRAHVVGLSYAAACALALAAAAPGRVRTLTLIEPPPVLGPDRAAFAEAIRRLLDVRRREGVEPALEAFGQLLSGPGWRAQWEAWLPGSVAQMVRDAATFFDADLPALLAWDISGWGDVRCPVLHIGGTASGGWFRQVRDAVLERVPEAEDVEVEGADHSLAVSHPEQVAAAVHAFVHRHPV